MNQVENLPQEITSLLAVYIADEIIGDGVPVEPDENLLMDGLVDSLGMLRVVAFLEARYDLKIPPEDFTIQNFRSLEVIADYISRLKEGSA